MGHQFEGVVKVGGSLAGQPDLREWAAAWGQLAAAHRLLFLPGGGSFADAVRAADTRHHLSDSAAHWMAILAMEQTAYLLADLIPGAALVADPAAAPLVGRAAVLAPFALLRRLNPLPHTWQVTSDSIAAWLAGYVGARRLALLKSVSGAVLENSVRPQPEVTVAAAAAAGLVDGYLPQALPPGPDCWLIDGRCPARLTELLATGFTVGTRLVG